MAGLTAPTYPSGTAATDLAFSALVDTLIADKVYYGTGAYTAAEVGTKFATQAAMATELSTYTKSLGELGEKPGKTDSKIGKLATRNYMIPGKRTSTVELTLNGISELQKNYLEGPFFSGAEITIIFVSTDNTRVTIFNGMRWTVDWSAEADGLWTVVISTQFSGSTADKVFVRKGLA